MKMFFVLISLLPFDLMAKTNIIINGYYHIDKAIHLSIPNRVKLEVKRVNELLGRHEITEFRFVLGEMRKLDTGESEFFNGTEQSESFLAYKQIKSTISNEEQLDFYVRFESPQDNNNVKGVAVQEGSFFAALLDPDDRFDTFIHELFHMIGLGDNVASYGASYVCGGKNTIMDERVLSRKSKALVLSDPSLINDGMACGHEIHFDNARLLKEILIKRFGVKQ